MSRSNTSRDLNPIRQRAMKAHDKVEIIRESIVDGTPIEDVKIRKEAQILRTVWPIITSEISWSNIVKKIVDLGICKENKAIYYVRMAEKVYGRVREADKAGRRAVLVEICLDALKVAKDDGDYKSVDRLVDKIAKLEGVYQTEDNFGNIYKDLQLTQIILSSNPQVLENQHIEIEVDE